VGGVAAVAGATAARFGATTESAGATVWLRSFGFAIDGAASSAKAPAADRILVKFAFMLHHLE
jgi:hypothetical protein